MDEKNYKSNIDSAALAEDYSLEDILDEYRISLPDAPYGEESLTERSKRIVLDAFDGAGGHSSISSIDELMEETVAESRAAVEVTENVSEETDEEPVCEESAAVEESAEEEDYSETEGSVDELTGLSEYELRELVDSDERERYASGDIDYDLGDEEYSGDELPQPKRDSHRRRRGSKGTMSPMLAILALITHKRSQRVKADAELPTAEEEDKDVPEVEPQKAMKLYAYNISSLKIRMMAAFAVSAVMLYITFAFYSFLPLAGAMKSPVGASLTLIILLLTVMLCGADIIASGLLNLIRGRASYETLASLSCLLAAADAAAIAIMKTGDFGIPFCAVSAISMCFALLGNYWSCTGLLDSFEVACEDEPAAVTAEKGISGKGSAMVKSSRGIGGFIRRSEEADIGEYMHAVLVPCVIAAVLIFGALAAFAKGQSESFIHCLSSMMACAAAFSGGVCFAYPFSVTAAKLARFGGAISGWAGVSDIGKSKGVVITDGDIFPQGTVSIAGIRVLQGLSADKVISYTGSVIAASANGLSPAFVELIRRNGYSICRVENFTPHDGGGLTAVVNGENIMVGNAGFMNLMGIRVPQKMANRNTVFTAISGELSGLFDIDYKPLPSVQDSLGVLMRSGCDAVFALRDFNMTPDSLRSKFHVSGESFNLPSYPDRFSISGAGASPQSPVAAIIVKEGMVPIVEVSKRGKRLYWAAMVGAILAAVLSGLGVLLMFFGCWSGSFLDANAAKAALIMLLCLIPNVLGGIWLQR